MRAAAVSEQPPDSPVVARAWCPGCEPFADPFLQILDTRYCDQHLPSRDGFDDSCVTTDSHLSGGAEAGGDANRLWCEFFHREAPTETAAKLSP